MASPQGLSAGHSTNFTSLLALIACCSLVTAATVQLSTSNNLAAAMLVKQQVRTHAYLCCSQAEYAGHATHRPCCMSKYGFGSEQDRQTKLSAVQGLSIEHFRVRLVLLSWAYFCSQASKVKGGVIMVLLQLVSMATYRHRETDLSQVQPWGQQVQLQIRQPYWGASAEHFPQAKLALQGQGLSRGQIWYLPEPWASLSLIVLLTAVRLLSSGTMILPPLMLSKQRTLYLHLRLTESSSPSQFAQAKVSTLKYDPVLGSQDTQVQTAAQEYQPSQAVAMASGCLWIAVCRVLLQSARDALSVVMMLTLLPLTQIRGRATHLCWLSSYMKISSHLVHYLVSMLNMGRGY